MTKNKLTIIVMVGPPASGKTSWSKEFVKGKSTWIRVNRDDLRLMCGDYWIPSREKLINTLEETTITSALEQGYNVIIDATNPNPKTRAKWEEIASNFDANIEYKEIVLEDHFVFQKFQNINILLFQNFLLYSEIHLEISQYHKHIQFYLGLTFYYFI